MLAIFFSFKHDQCHQGKNTGNYSLTWGDLIVASYVEDIQPKFQSLKVQPPISLAMPTAVAFRLIMFSLEYSQILALHKLMGQVTRERFSLGRRGCIDERKLTDWIIKGKKLTICRRQLKKKLIYKYTRYGILV